MKQVKETTFQKLDYRDIVTPFNGAIVMMDYWWLCKNGDPRMAAFYKKVYPQCHHKCFVVKNHEFSKDENLVPVFIKIAYCPRRPE